MDIQKIIKGFECCHVMVHDLGPDKSACGICPYKNIQTEEQINLGGIECIAALHDEARELILELLKNKADLSAAVSNLIHLITEQSDIVRCMDCKWHKWEGEMLLCTLTDTPHTYDWFCGDGAWME